MIMAGTIVAVLGLVGLIYCITKALQARRSGLEGDALIDALKTLVPVNLASFFLSAIGLMLIVLGIIL